MLARLFLLPFYLGLGGARALPPYDAARPAASVSRAERERNLDYLCRALRVRAPRPDSWDASCAGAERELQEIDDTKGFYFLHVTAREIEPQVLRVQVR